MKPTVPSPSYLPFLLFACLASVAHAQTYYLIRKSQVIHQTNGMVTATGFSANTSFPPTGRLVFTALAPTSATLRLPSGGVQAISIPNGSGFEFSQSSGTQVSLDTAFPNGAYLL
jgi:hypothetical protein